MINHFAMEFQGFLVFVALLSVSMLVSVYGTESSGEAYWKMNLGSDTNMPKVVKNALLDTKTNQANQEYANGAQAYAQQLSKVKSHLFGINYAKGAQKYNSKDTKTNQANREYVNEAQAYAQQLSEVKSHRIFNNYAKGAQKYNSKDTETNQANQEYANGAQAYAQQLSKVKSHLFGVNYAKGAQKYNSKDTKTNQANQEYANGAQAYAQQLSKVKSHLFGINYAKGAQKYNSKGSQILSDNSVLYFFQKDLIHPRSNMKLHFLMGAQKAKFMPSEVTKSMPFSSSKLPEILKFFAVKPGAENAKIMEETITVCETQAMVGEEKSCETSLEGMVNYAKSKLGNQIKAVSTEVNQETEQEYQIKSATKINNNEKNLVCHKLIYPYAVFSCHTLSKTDTYDVSLVDSAGKKVRAVAVCHKDTSHWNEEHLAFQLLKVKPGSVPICHFLDADAMVWVPK